MSKHRMPEEIPCPKCGKATTDGHLCHTCTDKTIEALHSLVSWWPDLFDTFTRQDRITPPAEGHGSGREAPLPFDYRAAELANDVRTVFVSWTKLTVEDFDAEYPADRISAMAYHLELWSNRLRTHEAAVEWADEMQSLARRVTKAIDSTDGQLVHIPRARCPLDEDGVRCGGELVAQINRDWSKDSLIRCRTCTTQWVYDADHWEALARYVIEMDDADDARLALLNDRPGDVVWCTVTELARVIHPVTIPSLYKQAWERKWQRRRAGVHVLYRLSDVMDWRHDVEMRRGA